jgi:carboxylesterase type B
VWIYGGGYTSGDKTSQAGNPIGLLEHSKDPVTGNPPIFVAMNYRVSGQRTFKTPDVTNEVAWRIWVLVRIRISEQRYR